MGNQAWDLIPNRFNGNGPGTTNPGAVEKSVSETNGAHPRLFTGISPCDYAEICQAAHVKHLAREQLLYLEGDAVNRVYLLVSGVVKITKFGVGGEEVILRLAVPGDVLGATNLLSSYSQCTTAEVFRPCRVLVWDGQVFQKLVERYPILHKNMIGILDEYLRELQERFYEVATGRVGPRVAHQLLRLLKSIGHAVNGEIQIGLSREELAQMTGTTLFTVSRLLSAWGARGTVRPGREAVAICDVPSLRAISEER